MPLYVKLYHIVNIILFMFKYFSRNVSQLLIPFTLLYANHIKFTANLVVLGGYMHLEKSRVEKKFKYKR